MADTKISALPASTTPLAGTEVLPIVQGGTTKNVSVSNLTSGRSISATTLTLSTGSLVPSTAGQGVNFTANTPSAGMTSQLLNWYEEGTWTPSVGGTATYFAQTGRYTRIGRLVTFNCTIYINTLGTGSTTTISGLPFTAAQRSSVSFGEIGGLATSVTALYGLIAASGTSIAIRGSTSASASNASITAFQNQTYLDISGSYAV